MKWYFKVLKQYVNFSGRAQRTEYWMFALFNVIFIAVACVLDNLLGITIKPLPYGALSMIYLLSTFLPNLAVMIRRLHDSGKSGWWVLILFVPYIGQVVIIVFLLLNGEQKPNRYGLNPGFSGAHTGDNIYYSENQEDYEASANVSPASYLGNITDAKPVEMAGNRKIKGEANVSLWGVISGFIITAFLLWGGLSGNLVLRGTESSIALVVAALFFLVYDFYKLVQYINLKSSNPVVEQSDETLALASLEYLRCPQCGSKSFTALFLGGKNVVNPAKAIATVPMTYKCDDCRQRFTAVPTEADKDEILAAPCEVVVKRMSNIIGAVTIFIVYLNGVKVGALTNGKAISFSTRVKHNQLVVVDQEFNAFKGAYHFEAEPYGRVEAFFNRKFL
ncbi:MAG: DUF805 domain-containing protein [Dysgonamonadaceae bacterium]|jgi:uncharacterized membrane protein YhaH (DUF805 family)/DNA-directed RNA polymerase subunit RPC12/RpoP|nr:DUF805 domain-containing protein [Dysgonamonadaceae bacterium]